MSSHVEAMWNSVPTVTTILRNSLSATKQEFPCNQFNNPFTHDSSKSKIEQFSKITKWIKLNTKQRHSKVLLNSFSTNQVTLLSIESKVYHPSFNSGGQWVNKGCERLEHKIKEN